MRISFPKIVFVCVLVVGSVYGIGILGGAFGANGLRSLAGSEAKRQQIEDLERQNQRLVRDNEAKRAYLEDLAINPEHMRLKIQDSYKLVTPGTKEFIVQDDKSAVTSRQ
ncbi:MAG TPA: hypothetical protein VGL72_17750 [Bryobacteraceae bacterium]|jgi:cell division protein FtsB